MNLYIANTTKQDRQFTYRLAERQNHLMRVVKAGQQIVINDLSQEEIAKIIKDNAMYGIKSVAELSRNRGFVGIIYSTDNPIKTDPMLDTLDQNDKVRDAEAAKRRETTAAAISQNMGKEVEKITGTASPPSRLEVEITDQSPEGSMQGVGVEVLANRDGQSRRVASRR
jgi:hypothetical protein